MKNGGRRLEFPFYLEFTPNFTYLIAAFFCMLRTRGLFTPDLMNLADKPLTGKRLLELGGVLFTEW